MSITPDRKHLRQRFQSEFCAEPERIFFSPGRINLIGEHIDYLGGTVLPAAIDRGIVALVRCRKDRLLRLRSVEQPMGLDIHLDSLPDRCDALPQPWTGYPTGMIRLYHERLRSGFDVLFASNLPVGSGLSSSAALEVLTGYLVHALSEDDFHISEKQRIQLALDAKSVENTYIGVQCGIMDQFAVAMGRKGHAIHLNTETLDYTYVPFNTDRHTIAVMNSNRPRKLSESKYNERRSECQKALALIQRLRPGYENLVSVSQDDLNLLSGEPVLLKRARHAVSENLRVKEAISALSAGNIERFGTLLNESHRSLKDDYEVSCYELDSLHEISRSHPACIGSRMTGAGFGGCAIALLKTVEPEEILDFARTTEEAYRKATGLSADIFAVQLMDGVREEQFS